MAGIVYHWKDPGPLARWTYVGVAVSALLSFGGSFLAIYLGLADPDAFDGDPASTLQMLSLIGLMGMLGLLAYIPGIMWLHRVSANAHSVEKDMKHSPAGAWAWYFVPIAHLFMPYLVLREIWRTTGEPSLGVLNLYWAVNVLSSLFGYVSFVISFANFSQPMPDSYTYVGMAISAPLYILFAWMVASLTKAQKQSVRIAEAFSDDDDGDD